jgi:endoglucanase
MKLRLLVKKSGLRAKWLMVWGAAGALIIGIFWYALPRVTAAPYYNYAEALQKSLYFYDAEKCGQGITGGRLEWRCDCHVEDAAYPVNKLPASLNGYRSIMDPDGDGYIDLSGGFHDAGDHVRFGLPQAYTFSTLGWGFLEFREAFDKTGQTEHMLEILKRFCDCYLKTIWRDAAGKVVAFCYMVGNGDIDHSYWGPPEFQDAATYPRTAQFATAANPASDISADVAAGLAMMYFIYQKTDPVYATKCRDTAIAMYEFAKTYRGLGYSGGYYGSAYDEDELSWAAAWLYAVTENIRYIRDIDAVDADGNYTGYMSRIIPTTKNDWQNSWTHCWDVVWAGAFLKLAAMFPEDEHFDYLARWNLEFWSGIKHQRADEKDYMKKTPAGYGMLNGWGSARYNCAAQLCALVYQKYHPSRTDFTAWAQGQMEYLMGNNPMGYSYIVGYGDTSAKHPHHRAAHGSATNDMNNPVEHQHILWGALVGGPDANDYHIDATTEYAYNEVAIDYNAAFVGALAGHYLLYGAGQKPLTDFPPAEPRVTEFYADARLERENTERCQIAVRIHNDSVQPPRYNMTLACRYYFNIAELLEAGQTIKDLSVAVMYDQVATGNGESAKISGPFAADAAGGLYYIQIDWAGIKFFGARELQFALIAAQDSDYATHLDASNDYSHQGLTGSYALAERVPVYSDGVKVFGTEPQPSPGVSPGTTPTATPVASPAIQVTYQCGAVKSDSNMICPVFGIKNLGSAALDLSRIKLRYWFTDDRSQSYSFACDYVKLGAANITGAFTRLTAESVKPNTYFEMGFAGGAGKLNVGANTGEIKLRFYRTDYSPFQQSDDYSFNPDLLTMGPNEKITAYIDGKLVYGIEP